MTASRRGTPHRGTATTRDRAMALLAEGETIAEVSRTLKVHRRTIEKWRTTAAGAATLETAKEQATNAFASTVEAARARLTAASDEAAEALLVVLREGEHGDKLRAASMIFDRVGTPRTQRVETEAAPMDTSKLTDAELADLEALLRKVSAAT